jgi:hypothetical protein
VLILEIQHTPMRELTKTWKLRRNLGVHPVGSVADRRWPEAGITTQVIPAQPSLRTFRGKVDTHCRPADLPTCRPADLPTCRPADLPTCRIWSRMTTGVPASATSFVPNSKYCLNLQLKGRVFHLMTCLQSTISLPRPQLLARVSSDIIARYHLSLVKSLFSLEVARNTLS